MTSEVTTHEEIDQRLPNGTVVDARYRIEGHLGRGGFAHVYRARQIHLDRQVALKVLELPPGPSGAQFQARFIQEARIAARIKHRNVVDVFDFGVPTDLGQPYLAMEFLDGHDLEAELVRNGPMEAKRALKLFGDCLAALAEGHQQGIVHKDLKPTNLYLCNPGTPQERLVVLDFGIARIFGDGSASLTQTGGFAGTPAYLAPEYIECQTVSPALDVYQMGLIIIETLTAFPAVTAANSMAYLLAHCQGQVTMPVELERTELGGVLRKATSLNQNDRYPSAKEFQEALAAVSAPRLEVGNRKMAAGFGNRGRLDSMDVLGETSPGMTRNTPPSGTPAVVPVVSQTSAKSDAALRWTLGALVILIILGLGVVATLMNRNSDTPDAVLVEPEVPVTVRDELPTPEAERPVVEVAKQPSTPAQEPVEAVAIPEPVLKDVPVKTVKSTKSTTKSKTADEKVKVGPKVDPSVAKKDPPQVEVKPPSSEPTPNEGKTTKAGETAIIAP